MCQENQIVSCLKFMSRSIDSNKKKNTHVFFLFVLTGSAYTTCEFEEGFCNFIQNLNTVSEWTRTNEAAGLNRDRTNESG